MCIFYVLQICYIFNYHRHFLLISQEKAKKVVVVGGGYIGMEVAAAAVGWNLDTTVSLVRFVANSFG